MIKILNLKICGNCELDENNLHCDCAAGNGSKLPISILLSIMGSATGGPGGHAPPPILLGGTVMHWPPPPDFRKNSVMYTINVQCFSLKKQWNA